MKIPLASSGLRDRDIEIAIEVLKSGNLTMGKYVKEFELAMAKYLKVKDFIMVNSGSSANLVMLEALLRPTQVQPSLHPGDSVLVPAVAWPTTIWPVIQLGLNPIFVDIDPITLALDLKAAQNLIDTSGINIRAIFPIHPLGYCIPNEDLEAFVLKNKLILINDTCESLGSWENSTHAGTTGIAGSFSFYFSHHITTMEGGGVATNDLDYADDLRSMRSHGWSRERRDAAKWSKEKSTNDSKFLFVSTGFNIRPMEIQAAIGLSQINDIDKFVSRRRHIAKSINSSLAGTDLTVIGSEMLTKPALEKSHSWMLVPILVNGSNASERKSKIISNLNKLGVETRPVLTGNFLAQPAIQRITKHNMNPNDFEKASYIEKSAFLVGAHHDLTDDQIEYLCESLKSSNY
jgi:CDP-6-deoxy-D-xylo-4-hexulose-3-dehydrase